MQNINSAFFTHAARTFLITGLIAGTTLAQQAEFVKGKPFRLAAGQAVLTRQMSRFVLRPLKQEPT